MASAIDPIVVQLLLETDQLKKQLDAVTKQFEEMGSKVEAQNKHLDTIGGGFRKLAGIIAGAFSVATVVNFFKQATQAASSFQAESEGVRQTFGANSAAIESFAKTAYKSAGLSEAAALGAAKGFGGFARAAGLAGQDAADFALSMTKAAGDLGSFNNVPTAEVLNAIKSGLAGQSEPLRRYNILLGDAALKAKAMSMGIMDANQKALTPQQKILATQQLILEQLGPAAGDFTKYASDYANSFQTIGAAMENLKAQAGSALLPALSQVMNAIQPLIDKLGPLVTKTFEAISPAIEALVPAIQGLMPILEPVLNILNKVAGFTAKLIEAFMPPLLKILQKIMPVMDKLAGAFLRMLEKLLPPLVKILDKLLIPALEFLVDLLDRYVVPYWEKLGDIIGVVADVIANVLVGAFQVLKAILTPIWAILKPMVDGLFALAGIKIGYTGSAGSGVDTTSLAGIMAASGQGGKTTTTTGTGTPSTDPKKAAAAAASAAYKKQLADLKSFVTGANTSVKEAQASYAQAVTAAQTAYNTAVTNATAARDKDLAELEKSHADRVLSINKDFADRLQSIVQQSMDRLRNAFAQVAKIDVGGIFSKSLTDNSIGQTVFTQMKNGIQTAVSWWGSAQAGGGVSGVIATLKDKLAASKKLIENSAALSGAGFSQTFIEQIVSQGSDMGNKIAEQILAASPESQKELQGLFTDNEAIAETGMDNLSKAIYDKAGLATNELKKLYTDTQSELVKALADEQTAYIKAQADINATFAKAMADANTTLKNAVNDAGVTLNDALNKINTDLDQKITAMKGKLGSMAGAVKTLQGLISSSQTVGTAAPVLSFSQAQGAAKGIVAGNTTNINTTVNAQTNATPDNIASTAAAVMKYNIPLSKLTA